MGQPPLLEFRRAGPDDIPACIAVAARALGWDPGEPHAAFFRWKHLDNPAGPSPLWVAVAGDRVVGFRAMLRWRFVGPGSDGGEPTAPGRPAREQAAPATGVVTAVRAVDTATDPDHRRRGIFRSLTLTAVEELTAEGAAFVFNTPNASSRAGYLTMGWVDAGRLGARIRVAGPAALVRLTRARAPARKWSEPLAIGDPIEPVAADLVGRIGPVDGLRTRRDTAHLVWRYGFGPLAYRVVSDDGAAAVVRLRR
ncbi:MAG: GNAT family N-acetyltransferase, partial [Actinomyces sp.]